MNKSKSNLVEMTQQCGSSIHRSLLVIALINLLGACGGATDTTADALTDLTSANQLTDAPQFTSKSAAAPTTDLLTTPSSNTPASSNASSAATNNSRAAAPVGSGR